MTTPINPAFLKAAPLADSPPVQPTFAEHLDMMFGNEKRHWKTGDHVEVIRLKVSDGKRFFRKSFLGNFAAWTEREHLLLLTLKQRLVPHIQETEGYSIRNKYFESLDAGPDLKHWLDLPVLRNVEDNVEELEHIFQDCAQWFSLARWGILALHGIHAKGCVHLDIKADNLCLPCQFGNNIPKTQVLPDWSKLRLIDFAFSIWESVTPLTAQTPLIIGKATANSYQSQQLLNAIEAGDRAAVLARASKLDWRCDLYSFGYLLTGILDHLPEQCLAGKGGWKSDRLQAARELVDTLLAFDDDWKKNLEHLPKLPHASLLKKIDNLLDEDELKQRLSARWDIAHRQDWQSGRAVTDIPITKVVEKTKIKGGNYEPEWFKYLALAFGLVIIGVFWLNIPETPVFPDSSTSSISAELAGESVEEKHKKDQQEIEELAYQKADLPAQLVDRLLKAPVSQLEVVARQTLPEEANEASQVASAAYALLFTSWSGAALETPTRTRKLERLLWLHDALPAKEKRTQQLRVAEQYAKDSQTIENGAWWKSDTGMAAGAKEKGWLKETQLLAKAGILRAQFALSTSLLNGKQGVIDSAQAGEWLARALKNDSEADQTEHSTIISAILRRVNAQVLVGNDRQFTQAILPGLQRQSTRNNPAASWLLANTLACRVTPPQYDEARKVLEKLSQINDWRNAAIDRLKTIDNPQWCTFLRAAKE